MSLRIALAELVRLERTRFRRSSLAKLGRGVSVAMVVCVVVSFLAIRASEGATFPFEGIAVGTTRLAIWVVGGLLAFAAAYKLSETASHDGVTWMAMSRGASSSVLLQVRFFAIAAEIFLWVALPIVTAGLATVAVAQSVAAAGLRLWLVLIGLVVSAMTGLLLAAFAVVCDALRPSGGRSLLLGLLVLPWVASALLHWPNASVPGALEAFLQLALEVAGLRRFA